VGSCPAIAIDGSFRGRTHANAGIVVVMVELALLASLQQQTPPRVPENSYLFFVASEGVDQVALVRFGRVDAQVEHRTYVRLPLIDSAGPRALRIAPGGQLYYLTTAHGFPNGELIKMRIAADSTTRSQPADTIRGREPLGSSPGALQLTPDGEYAWVVNATPIEERQPSSISVVYLGPMVEVARIPVCAAPRGARLTDDGTRFYTACASDDELLEVDVHAMRVSRRLSLRGAGSQRCAPSAVTASADGSRLYVTCQQANDLIEVDAASWAVVRRIAVGIGPGDVAVSYDGRTAVVTNQGGQTVSLVDLAAGREAAHLATALRFPLNFVIDADDHYAFVSAAWELAILATMRRVPANVVISPDDRYAFVSIAGAGADPGTVDVIDLAARMTVATVEVGPGAHGIAFWKMETGKAAP
jgi:YVTN family beta-propeller protein